MRKFITNIPAAAVNEAFTADINTALSPMKPYILNLTDEEKLGLRTMGEGREGYARMISRVATQFPNSLSRVDDPAELSGILEYNQRLEANKLALLQALESIDEIQRGAAADIMTMVDRYAANLQLSRANDGSLDLAMADVDAWNQRFANNPENPTPPTP